MHPTPTLRLVALATLGALGASPSFAQNDSYYYGGLSIGQSRAKIDEEKIAARLIGAGLTTTAVRRDARDTGYKLFGGYQFNRYFALEGGYFDLGRFNFTADTAPAGSLEGQLRLRGLNLDLVGTLPLGERLSALGRVGAASTKTSDTFSGTGAVHVLDAHPSQRATSLKVGAGLQYAFSPYLIMRGEAERYRVKDATGGNGHVNLVSVSLVFPFGRAPTTAVRSATAPVYVAPVPAPAPAAQRVVVLEPAPVVATAPPPAPAAEAPVRRRVSFAAESLFTFDQSIVLPQGKAALDTFARELDGTRYDLVNVEGHTDRLGSTAYNQKLSEQRAESVKAYLVSSGKVDAAKISSVGKSESDPVTKPEDCKGNRPSAQLIACLQPDRRVEVEVVGTR